MSVAEAHAICDRIEAALGAELEGLGGDDPCRAGGQGQASGRAGAVVRPNAVWCETIDQQPTTTSAGSWTKTSRCSKIAIGAGVGLIPCWLRTMRELALAAILMGLAGNAQASAFDRACQSARVAEKSYTDDNIAEVLVHMTAAFEDMGNGQVPPGVDARRAWEDMMTFDAQYDNPRGKTALEQFIENDCQ